MTQAEFIDITIEGVDVNSLQKVANNQWTVSFAFSSVPVQEWRDLFLSSWNELRRKYGREKDLFYLPKIIIDEGKVIVTGSYDELLEHSEQLRDALVRNAEETNGSYLAKKEKEARTEDDERRNLSKALKDLKF